MAKTTSWVGGTGDYTNAAGWDNGAPANGDTVRILRGDDSIVSGMTGANTLALLEVGGTFQGRLGAPGSPLVLGNTTKVVVSAPRAVELCFSFSGATCTEFVVEETNVHDYACAILAGTVTALHARLPRKLYIGPITLTTFNCAAVSEEANVFIDAGCALATLIQTGGRILSESDVDTLFRLEGGVFDWKGSSGGTMAALEIHGTGRFDWRSPASVITSAKVFSGLLNGTVDDRVKTLTNGEVWGSGIIDLENGPRNIVVSNNVSVFGGTVKGTSNMAIKLSGR